MPATDELHHRDRCAISGIGKTDYSSSSGRSPLTLATQAALAAIADAGLTPDDIDGIVRADYDTVTPHGLAMSLGMKNLHFWGETGPGGAASSMMIGLAVGAVLSGQARNVLVFRAHNGRSGMRFANGARRLSAPRVGGNGLYDEFYLPYGLLVPGQAFAMAARRHMLDHGTTREQLAEVALACRANANATRHAQMHDRQLSMDEYMAARPISTPLVLFDFCLETDGGCALVVTRAERAKDAPKVPILIRAIAGGVNEDRRPGLVFPMLTRDDVNDLPARRAAEMLWKRAGLGPTDIDVAQIYDCYTIAVLLQLEAYGFCPRGASGAFAASGALRPGGALPINTDGGNLSGGYIHGLNHFVEGVRQLRGESEVRIDGAEVSLVTGGPLPVSGGVVLRRGG
ncbi:hypothetical protein O4H66_15495 [Comamonadaceae bacterium G21597-S1]|nr:hypothetical protein [Comamonadaceae bacterium G21597-S1]